MKKKNGSKSKTVQMCTLGYLLFNNIGHIHSIPLETKKNVSKSKTIQMCTLELILHILINFENNSWVMITCVLKIEV